MIRQLEYNKKVCDFFANSEKINLIFHGEGVDKELLEYCEVNGYKNIRFTGKYDYKKDVEKFVEGTDILNCLYDNDIVQQPALVVKLYEAIHYKIPMIVNKGSYLQEYCSEFDVSLALDINENSVDDITDWFNNINEQKTIESYVEFQKLVDQENSVFEKALLDF